MVENPDIGVMLEVPPDTALEADGVTEFEGDLSISEVPIEFAPMQLPEEFQPAMLVSIQPTGVTFNQPLAITFPNTDNLPPGNEVDIYSLDAETGSFVIVGIGTVSADGTVIETTSGGIVEATWHFPLGPVPSGDPSGNNDENDDPDNCVECDTASGTHVNSGNLTEAHSLASYRSLNQARSLRFVYNSTSADPRPVIVTDTTIPLRSAVPNTISTRLVVAGVDQGEELFTSTAGLAENIDETIHQAAQFDASGFATGSYAYRLFITNNFDASSVSAVQTGRVLVNNESTSAFGAGWTLDGLERLHSQNDGRVVLTRGDGGALVFEPEDFDVTFTDFSDLSRFQLNGAAAAINATPVIVGGQTVLGLTGTGNQASGAYLLDGVPLTRGATALSFSTAFQFQLANSRGSGDSDGPGGDGFSFVLAPNQTNLGTPASFGGFLGFSEVSPSVIVEFDTFANSWDGGSGNHVGINVNGSVTSLVQQHVGTRLNNGAVWFVWIDYDGPSKQLEVRLAQTPTRPGAALLARTLDIAGVIGQPTAFAGFGSGTGAAVNNHYIRSWQFTAFNPGAAGIALFTPPGNFSTLVRNPDNSFTRTLKNGTAIDYDAQGLMTARVDRNGNTTVYAYDASDNLTTITDPVGLVTTLAYTGGLLTGVTDPAARVTTFAHDGAGDLVSITDPDLSQRLFAYDGDHRLTSQTSKRNFVSTYLYGFHGRNTRADRPDGSFVLVAPSEAVGLIDAGAGLGTPSTPADLTRPEDVVATFTDGNGNLKSFGLNRFGSRTSTTDGIGAVTARERDANNKTTRIVMPGGRVTEMTYDSRGNRLTRRKAVGTALEQLTTFEYEPVFNKVTKVTDPALNETTFAYDGNGNLLSRTDALTNTASFTYDARGLVLTSTDRNGEVTSFTYDLNGNLDTITDAELNVTDFTRDAAGNVTAMVQGMGTPEARTTAMAYDARNRLLTATDGAGGTNTFRYDAAGNLIEVEDATGLIQFRSYDTMNRLTQVDDPGRGIITTAYDLDGNATSVTDALRNVTSFEYDAGDRVTKQIDALSNERLFGFDAEDNLTAVTVARTNATSFAYDLLNRVTRPRAARPGPQARGPPDTAPAIAIRAEHPRYG